MRGYYIKKTGRYNYSVTIPKWLVAQIGEMTELFWVVADDKIYLTTEKPEEETQREKVRKLNGWVLVLNQSNPNISTLQDIIFGYNFSLKKYFFISTKLNINLIGEKDEMLEKIKEHGLSVPPDELISNLDEYCRSFLNQGKTP